MKLTGRSAALVTEALDDLPIIGRNRTAADPLSGEVLTAAQRVDDDTVVLRYRAAGGATGAARQRFVFLEANRWESTVLSWQVVEVRTSRSDGEFQSRKGGATAPLASLAAGWEGRAPVTTRTRL